MRANHYITAMQAHAHAHTQWQAICEKTPVNTNGSARRTLPIVCVLQRETKHSRRTHDASTTNVLSIDSRNEKTATEKMASDCVRSPYKTSPERRDTDKKRPRRRATAVNERDCRRSRPV